MAKPPVSFCEALAGASRPLVGAHRGASADFAENTTAAFVAAAAQGADFLELDVRLSVDGVPMVIHDAAVDRTTRGHGLVRKLTATMLEGYGVPALATVLGLGTGRIFFNVELKPDGDAPELTAQVLGLIKTLHLERYTLVSSFDHMALAQIKTSAPSILTGLLYESPLTDPIGYAQDLGAEALHPYFRLADARLCNAARDAGLFTIPWTVDRPLYLRYFAAIGAQAVITNRPAVAVALLKCRS
ncbi:glycerophosphodiester phosphodiesterase [Anaeroselena agilis]|uniref:Glycerophosphodiester phosphodiesterase family protein n=1 Tax=Anaeroselena agilis TaxID=3063788 RepID=A0ABU3NWE2_9FIRM|nr:glycerophosphodiester phosphodiesterase family protein [Selenomonadales bacterium 4137-cl]